MPSGFKPTIGQRFLLLGFGEPNAGQLSGGYMTVASYIGSTEFYASSYQGQNACPGDSGGPALISIGNRTSIIGVVSRGPKGCQAGSSVIFPIASTVMMAHWIRTNA